MELLYNCKANSKVYLPLKLRLITYKDYLDLRLQLREQSEDSLGELSLISQQSLESVPPDTDRSFIGLVICPVQSDLQVDEQEHASLRDAFNSSSDILPSEED